MASAYPLPPPALDLGDSVNLTPHALSFYSDDGARVILTVPPAPCGPLRLLDDATKDRRLGPVLAGEYGAFPAVEAPAFTGIAPAPLADLLDAHARLILVSMPVGQYLRDHPLLVPSHVAVFGPDSGPDGAVRDASGVILGCKRVVRYV